MKKPYKFSGDDYVEKRDKDALSNQLERVLSVMKDQKWRSVSKLQQRIQERFGVSDPENSLQAQLRNLRKAENGYFEVPRKRIKTAGRGYYVYKLGGTSNLKRKSKKLATKSKEQLISIVLRLRKTIKKMDEQMHLMSMDIG